MIPDEAVEVARESINRTRGGEGAIRAMLEAAAPHLMAAALNKAADEFDARLPDGTGNGRAYNSYRVAAILRERAEKLTRPTA